MNGRRLTLGEIEVGTCHPMRNWFASGSAGLAEYVEAFHYWRAVHRDARLTPAEGQAVVEVLIAGVRR